MLGTGGLSAEGQIASRVLREALERAPGGALLTVASASMRPCLHEGDKIRVQRVSPRSLAPGDVVVYDSEAAGLVVHRLVWRNHLLGQPTRIITKGDAHDRLDRSFGPERLVGRVVSVQRGEVSLSPTRLPDRIRCVMQAGGYFFGRCVRAVLGRRAPAALSERAHRLEDS